jgi:heat shock protein HtpX
MWEQIQANRNRSLAIALAMAVLLTMVGAAVGLFLVGDPFIGVGVGLILWAILAVVAYRGGSEIMLNVAGARRIEKKDNPRLWNIVEEMTIASGLPRPPAIYIIDDPAPNAFATGRDPEHAAVAVTTGLLQRLNRDELQGVIAHEIGHVRNRDVLLMIMAGVMLGTMVLLADVAFRSWLWGGRLRTRASSRDSGQAIIMLVAILVMILAPIMARLMYLAISRKREYLADASAAQFTRYPEGLASALEKISRAAVPSAAANRVTAPMYIVAPLMKKGKRALGNLGSTHPPLEKRIAVLRSMAGGASLQDYERAYRLQSGEGGVIPASALKDAGKVEARQPSPTPEKPTTAAERAREAMDTLWKVGQYAFLACVCGARIKVPPGLPLDRIACPHCGAGHRVRGPATAGATPIGKEQPPEGGP